MIITCDYLPARLRKIRVIFDVVFSSVNSLLWCVCVFYVSPCHHNCTMIGTCISTYKVYITLDYSGIELAIHCVPDSETQTLANVRTVVLLTTRRRYLAPPQLECDFLTARILILRSVAIEILDYYNQNKSAEIAKNLRETQRFFIDFSTKSPIGTQ